MTCRTLTNTGTGRLTGFGVAAITAVTLVAAFAMGSYVIPGGGVMGPKGWPQPIGWIIRVLVVESWPTYGTLEIRWLAWAIGMLGLTVLAAWTAKRWTPRPQAGSLLAVLAGYGSVLVGLVAMLAVTSPVPALGFSWTWQVALALTWMLVLYWWSVRLPVEVLARAIGMSLTLLAAISLLYSLQGAQRYPNWPVGNVLLLTTACLAGIFVLGAWAYGLLAAALQAGRRGDWVRGLAVSVLLLLLAVVVSMAGRRAGVLGLLAGTAFILLLSLVRSRRGKIVALTLVVAAGALGAVLVPRLFQSGRWETVVLRAALYKNTALLLRQSPLVGIGPGHLGAYLTSAMRPLHTESPRLFHGEISEEAHSEPLHALAELGVPVGLLYLLVPLGGLAGYAVAYRRLRDPEPERLSVLGLGAALAAVMAAEATSVGMRHAGVAALLWALVGIGYACGLRSGGFDRVVRRVDGRLAEASRWATALWAAWLAAAGGLVVLAGLSIAGSYHLNNGLRAWNRNQLLLADGELDRAWLPPASDHWMIREYLQGRTNLVLARQATDPQEAALRQGKAVARLSALVSLSPAYKDAPVWLGRALGNIDQLVGLCRNFCQIDPYDREALLVLASQADNAADKLKLLRAALRNEDVIAPLARMIVAAEQDPAGRQILAQWLTEADKALPLTEPAQWPDPLALETYRLAVVVYGERKETLQAARAAARAAVLCKYLEQDVRRRRREAVELETYLDQAWFGWMNRPEAGRSLQAALEERSRILIYGEAENFSARMTLQFLAMLRLIDDKPGEAGRDLLASEGATARSEVIRRLLGLSYARLVVTLGPRASPASEPASTQAVPAGPLSDPAGSGGGPLARQVANWTRQGKRVLGSEQAWAEALREMAARRTDPWWHGVLTE